MEPTAHEAHKMGKATVTVPLVFLRSGSLATHTNSDAYAVRANRQSYTISKKTGYF